ncbi:GMC family oxidoreductase [Microbacterium sp. K24]|uniref:GMC oxidoreductase n=1 Tax=Microbacterium sp. K24 TaxID=2305446 RepID=UPI00109CE39F|nr:GMC family oxidoreductase [Microbacterium sp. K24]
MREDLIEIPDRALVSPGDSVISTDILVVGSGMGGGTLAWALRNSGREVLIVERGAFLPREPENSQPDQVFVSGRYKTASPWLDGATKRQFQPGAYYWVGGNTKMYGACLPRFREDDFEETTHEDGISPRWPFSYADLEPFYVQAEKLYQVHGRAGEDPSDPPRSEDYPAVALEHEPEIQRLAERLQKQGLSPFHMPNGMNLDTLEERRRNTTADGSPSEDGTKSDAENRAIRPALQSDTVRLLTGAFVEKLLTNEDGTRVVAAEAIVDGRRRRIEANQFVVSAGAVNSAALLLRSASDEHPDGLANSSGLLGRNYMQHNSTFFIAINPFRRNRTAWQKTLGINDWYWRGPDGDVPLGSVQMLGKLQGAMIKSARRWIPTWMLNMATRRSIDMFLLTEDLPRYDNRVTLTGGRPTVTWTPNNVGAHRRLTELLSSAVRKAGYPIVLTERMGISSDSHMCGTAVAGNDPKRSVLDKNCRTHDIPNLWVVDGSFFPSSAGLNPALTIAANALRVAPEIAKG